MRWALGALLTLAVSASAGAQPVAPPMDPRDAARAVTDENAYPTSVKRTDSGGSLRSFPSAGGDGSDEDDSRRNLQRSGRTDLEGHRAGDGRNPAEPESSSGWEFPQLSALSSVGQVLAYVLLGAGALALLALLGYLLFNFLPRGDRRAPADEASALAVHQVTADGLPFVAGDPDALAAEGRFAEAILALLVQALRAVGWRPAIQGSMTAREVLARLDLGDGRRATLGAVVGGAERVRFADAPATRELYEALRAQRDALLAHVDEVAPREAA